MKKLITAALFGVAAFSIQLPAFAGAGAAGHAHGHTNMDGSTTFGRPGNPKKPARTVEVIMREGNGTMEFVPNIITIKKGEQVRFKLKNDGELDHELVLGTLADNLKHAEEMKKNPDMEHDDPNAKRLSSKKTGSILWRFSEVGEFDFSCLIPGHREAGMSGKIIVR